MVDRRGHIFATLPAIAINWILLFVDNITDSL